MAALRTRKPSYSRSDTVGRIFGIISFVVRGDLAGQALKLSGRFFRGQLLNRLSAALTSPLPARRRLEHRPKRTRQPAATFRVFLA